MSQPWTMIWRPLRRNFPKDSPSPMLDVTFRVYGDDIVTDVTSSPAKFLLSGCLGSYHLAGWSSGSAYPASGTGDTVLSHGRMSSRPGHPLHRILNPWGVMPWST